MFRSLFSIAAVCSLLFSSLVASSARAAKRCPDEPPSTILSLYKSSDVVYIGKFNKTVEGDVASSEENYKTINMADHFSVSTTLKGESRKFFVRDYVDYRYSNADPEPVEESESEDEDNYSLKSGDSVILFLRHGENEEGVKPTRKDKRPLELAHYRDGVKRVDAADLSSYEKRLRELKGIFSSSKNGNDAEVLNWIIRTTEDPVTRWDGAFELLASFEALDWAEQRKIDEAEEAEETSDEPENEDADESTHDDEEVVEEEPVEEEEFDNSVYAKLLTDAQKARLMNIAVSSKPAKAEEKKIVRGERDGDSVLFDVVKRWGDSKLASVMLDRLRSAGDDNYEKQNWMSSIAEVLKNKELSAISEKFSDVTYQADDEEFIESKAENKDEVVNGPVVEPKESEGTKTESAEPAKEEMAVITDGKVEKKTYKQHRDELLADFINKATVILTQEKEKAIAK